MAAGRDAAPHPVSAAVSVGACDMDPRHAPDPPRRSPFDWRGHLHRWAAEINREVYALWLPPEPGPPRPDVIVFDAGELDTLLHKIWNR